MIITAITELNIQIVLDLVESKIIVALLREVRQSQAIDALKSLQMDGFSISSSDAAAVAQSLAFTLSNYTDRVKKTEPGLPGEAMLPGKQRLN